jgi:putative spermidine/putrescine transport system substrate-binding protein
MFDGGKSTTKDRLLSRRDLLQRGARFGAGAAAGAILGAGARAIRASAAPAPGGKVVVRDPGGAYEEALRKTVFQPFTAETGIEVVPFPTNAAKILAMVESGNIEIDVLDVGEFPALQLQNRNALQQLDRSKFTRTNLADLAAVRDYYVGENTYATVLGYNKQAFPGGHPTSWAEFWDVKRFLGGRTLEDMAAEYPNLEFALLADGVPMDKLYPLDVDRAFRKLKEIRPYITKWWDSGAVAAQMMADKQVLLGSIWNGRIQTLIDGGAPLAIEWNQASIELQVLAILKGAPNLENAYKYVDYAMQPKPQAEFAKIIGYGPINKRAFAYIDQKTADKLPTSPQHVKTAFFTNTEWWIKNRDTVNDRWQAFLLGG